MKKICILTFINTRVFKIKNDVLMVYDNNMFMKVLKRNISDEEASGIFRMIDHDKDGKGGTAINLEFANFLRNIMFIVV